MANLILRQRAIDDLNEIWIYTYKKWSEKQADKYYETLELALKQITKKPNIGKAYDVIYNNLLGLKIGKHIIFYQIASENEIEVIRILHEQMDLKTG